MMNVIRLSFLLVWLMGTTWIFAQEKRVYLVDLDMNPIQFEAQPNRPGNYKLQLNLVADDRATLEASTITFKHEDHESITINGVLNRYPMDSE